jgi:hypothetical protein
VATCNIIGAHNRVYGKHVVGVYDKYGCYPPRKDVVMTGDRSVFIVNIRYDHHRGMFWVLCSL